MWGSVCVCSVVQGVERPRETAIKRENRSIGSTWAHDREKGKDRTRHDTTVKKSQNGNILPIWGEAHTAPIETKICMVGHLADVITFAKFEDDIFRGYDFTGGRISQYFYWFLHGPYNSAARLWYGMIVWMICRNQPLVEWLREWSSALAVCPSGPLGMSVCLSFYVLLYIGLDFLSCRCECSCLFYFCFIK